MEKLEIMIKLASDRNIDQVQNRMLFACMLLMIIAPCAQEKYKIDNRKHSGNSIQYCDDKNGG